MEVTIIALKESIAHWERMITFAKTQPKDEHTSVCTMIAFIGEDWGGNYCSLCRTFMCKDCPLFISGNGCDSYDSPWEKVARSISWKDWLINADNLLTVLNKCLIVSLLTDLRVSLEEQGRGSNDITE